MGLKLNLELNLELNWYLFDFVRNLSDVKNSQDISVKDKIDSKAITNKATYIIKNICSSIIRPQGVFNNMSPLKASAGF